MRSPLGFSFYNWLTSIEKDGEPQVSYSYDEIGNIRSVTDKLGNTTEYTYDKSSRMSTVSFDGRTVTYDYDENGNRKSIDYNGSAVEVYSYDKNNRLLTLTNNRADGSEISGYSYTYDLAGRQINKTDSYGTTSYTYDKAGRILKVEAPGKTTVYAYDWAGNRISQDETYTSEQVLPAIDGTGLTEIKYILKRSEYVYSNAGRLLKLVEKLKDAEGAELLQKITSFRYDNNGNELRRTVEYVSLFNKANPKAYEAAVYGEETTEPIHAVVDQTVSKYDGFNRLVGTEIIRGMVRTTVEYAYNGDGLRVEKTVRRSDKGNAAEVTGYLYDRQHVILETRGNDDIRYVRGINYIGRIDATGKLSYFMFNGHGDVVQTVSEAGDVENQYDYDVFGNLTLTVESYNCSIRYAGEFYDSETGLYYLRARYYDPYIGRFISEDSYWGEDNNPLSLNLYTYAQNDPLKYIDPSGHRVENIIGGGSKPSPSKSRDDDKKKSGGGTNGRGITSSGNNKGTSPSKSNSGGAKIGGNSSSSSNTGVKPSGSTGSSGGTKPSTSSSNTSNNKPSTTSSTGSKPSSSTNNTTGGTKPSTGSNTGSGKPSPSSPASSGNTNGNRETTVIHNRVEQYNIAVQTG